MLSKDLFDNGFGLWRVCLLLVLLLFGIYLISPKYSFVLDSQTSTGISLTKGSIWRINQYTGEVAHCFWAENTQKSAREMSDKELLNAIHNDEEQGETYSLSCTVEEK